MVQHAEGESIGKWGLLGGWMQKEESADDAAQRILYELTSMDNIYLEQLKAFTDPKRVITQPPARQLPVPGADRRRQDRAGARARRIPVRRRAGDGPHRHVRVPGEAHGVAHDRRASRIRRLRGGRPADRSRAPAAVRRRPVRRDREGASRSAERPAAAARRRPPDRRQGPDGRLQEHGRDHDVESRQPVHRRAARTTAAARIDEGTRRQVMDALREHFRPEFLNRIDEIIFFHALGREHMKQIIDIQMRGLMKRLEERKIHVAADRRGQGAARARRVRSDVRRAAAQAHDSAPRARPAGAAGPRRRVRRRRHGRRRRRAGDGLTFEKRQTVQRRMEQ